MELLIVATYYLLLLVVTVYALHRLHLVMAPHPGKRDGETGRRGDGETACLPSPRLPVPPSPHLSQSGYWPSIAVQLPVFNEPNVIERLIDAAAALEYPGSIEIQILDDSTDATTELIAARVDSLRESGLNIWHIRRGSREGFKAGALHHGLLCSDAELFAIFDADFVPPHDALTRMVPAFDDPQVGMVQARWGHLNRDESALTRVQALFLDGHFAVESATRYASGLFFNFNGTAGIWRRTAIEQADGWSSSTLTEDLDLSYRAQLAGWKFVFMPEMEVPAELPAALSGFQGQQHRWAKGSIQTARKLLLRIFRAHIPLATKVEAFFHLTSNVAYVITLALALLLVPAMEIRYRSLSFPLALMDFMLFAIPTGALVLFCREGERRVGRVARWRDILLLLPVGISLSVTNATAVIEGSLRSGGEFRRTLKRGSGSPAVERPPRLPIGELVLLFFFAFATVMLILEGRFVALPFVLIFLVGYAYGVILGANEWSRFLAAKG